MPDATYAPTHESLSQHAVPAWFDDAKFGIFIHWGPYSVPAWAPARPVEFSADRWFAENAYAEWYLNTLSILGSPTAQHHAATYGADYPYERFGATLRENVRGWSADRWAELFASAGARYVIPTSKHHDGFLMWPSEHPNPHRIAWHLERDVLGELAGAVRGRGMRFGLYYSGGLDWTFGGLPIDSLEAMRRAIPQTGDYARYADAHWRELIERYQPSVLWNDIGYPKAASMEQLFADYYNAMPDGVVNNRFDAIGARQGLVHHDFFTPEYSAAKRIHTKKWEACRGIGNSFGYNSNESEDQYASARELIHLLIDVVSKNGNLLLNVGPTGAGDIPPVQAQRLLEIGAWLRVNGEAIYGTRPWHTADAVTTAGLQVRFTSKDDAIYAIVLDPAAHLRRVSIDGVQTSGISMLGREAQLSWRTEGDGVVVELPEGSGTAPAITLKLRR